MHKMVALTDEDKQEIMQQSPVKVSKNLHEPIKFKDFELLVTGGVCYNNGEQTRIVDYDLAEFFAQCHNIPMTQLPLGQTFYDISLEVKRKDEKRKKLEN